jgi:formylglycine-generating enzyme required for sulfatase activity
MVGNVWELTTGEVLNGLIETAALPQSGYIAGIGQSGLASETTSTPQQLFNEDYFWSSATGTYAVMRGGYYGSRADGGLYSTQAAISNSFASAAVGFRCVKSL